MGNVTPAPHTRNSRGMRNRCETGDKLAGAKESAVQGGDCRTADSMELHSALLFGPGSPGCALPSVAWVGKEQNCHPQEQLWCFDPKTKTKRSNCTFYIYTARSQETTCILYAAVVCKEKNVHILKAGASFTGFVTVRRFRAGNCPPRLLVNCRCMRSARVSIELHRS